MYVYGTSYISPHPPPLDSNSYRGTIFYDHLEVRAEIPNRQWVNMQNVIGITN